MRGPGWLDYGMARHGAAKDGYGVAIMKVAASDDYGVACCGAAKARLGFDQETHTTGWLAPS